MHTDGKRKRFLSCGEAIFQRSRQVRLIPRAPGAQTGNLLKQGDGALFRKQ